MRRCRGTVRSSRLSVKQTRRLPRTSANEIVWNLTGCHCRSLRPLEDAVGDPSCHCQKCVALLKVRCAPRLERKNGSTRASSRPEVTPATNASWHLPSCCRADVSLAMDAQRNTALAQLELGGVEIDRTQLRLPRRRDRSLEKRRILNSVEILLRQRQLEFDFLVIWHGSALVHEPRSLNALFGKGFPSRHGNIGADRRRGNSAVQLGSLGTAFEHQAKCTAARPHRHQ